MSFPKAANFGKAGIALDSTSNCVRKCLTIPIDSTPTGSEQSSSLYVLPAGAVVDNVFVNVTTAEAGGTTKTLNVGTLSTESGGDADGFIAGISVSTTGVKRATLASAGVTVGVLLRATIATTTYAGETYPVTVDRTVSFTAGSNDFTTLRGSIHITYYQIG